MNSSSMPAGNELRVLCLGDVVGRPGRRGIASTLRSLRSEHQIHCVIANGENASGGLGIDPESARELRDAGVDILTLGDHTWQRAGIGDFLEKNADWCIRPANYPPGAPGRGWTTVPLPQGKSIGVFNLLGRVYMTSPLDCPFRAADEILAGPLASCGIRICDMHAGATSEKVAMGRYLDGKVSAVFGTHTHVQTADEQLLPAGTGYISDLGMCGPADGVIGMATEVALARFLSGMHHSYKISPGGVRINGAIISVDRNTGRALSIERLQEAVTPQE